MCASPFVAPTLSGFMVSVPRCTQPDPHRDGFFFPSSVWKNSTGLQRTMTSTPSNHGRINLLEGPRGRKLPLSLHWSLHPSISRPVCAADALSALDFFIFFPVSVCDWIKISIFFKYRPDNHAGWGSWVLYHPASVTRGYTDTKEIL